MLTVYEDMVQQPNPGHHINDPDTYFRSEDIYNMALPPGEKVIQNKCVEFGGGGWGG